MSILLDVGIGLEINVLTSKFILLGYQMLGEMGCHPEICFYAMSLMIRSNLDYFSNFLIRYTIEILYFYTFQTFPSTGHSMT